MRISDWSADVCSSDLVPNGSIRDIAGQWMAGSPAYDPAAITIPTMVIVGAADTDTPPALAREVFDRLGTDERLFAEVPGGSSEEHTSELQSLMHLSYAVFCLKHKIKY